MTKAETDPASEANESLLALIDRLSALLDRTELTELEVQVGSTGLILRKPSALAPAVTCAAHGFISSGTPRLV